MTETERGGPASAPVVQLDGYEGPIDFLLELARAQKVDLGRLSIVALVDQYVAVVEAPGARATLAERGDWLIAASWLVLLKSKLLVNVDDEAEVPEAERLRDSLLRAEQRRQARALAGWLERRPQLGQKVFARGALETAPTAGSGESGDLLDLLLACFDLLDVPRAALREAVRPYAPPPLDVWPLAEALAHLRTWLRDHPGGGELGELVPGPSGSMLASPLRCRSNLASGFLAGLELAKHGEAFLQQDQTFGPLRIRLSASAPSS
ncbi:segregation/condensation protein A [Roseomonas nepalensis]|uniref:Segregation and condensation protein A n=1 Tax=Muricoccus nepalensis TaxID=1854500 RepID=A0A502G3S2_9PROT|nr:ScpA family protein [Roseomonas nepalensis]TPG55866.1 segregation/condensation protein A [Roseomonas nepalensis]